MCHKYRLLWERPISNSEKLNSGTCPRPSGCLYFGPAPSLGSVSLDPLSSSSASLSKAEPSGSWASPPILLFLPLNYVHQELRPAGECLMSTPIHHAKYTSSPPSKGQKHHFKGWLSLLAKTAQDQNRYTCNLPLFTFQMPYQILDLLDPPYVLPS